MRKSTFGYIKLTATISFAALFMFLMPTSAAAQQDPAMQDQAQREVEQRDEATRPNGDLISRLNLTVDQVRQIRQIRQKNRFEWQAVRQRLGAAQRALDDAIYADAVDESLIETRVQELGAAQAAAARMRSVTELSIRRVLTADQLDILKRIREEAQQGLRNRRTRGDNSLQQGAGTGPNTARPRDNVSRRGLAPRNPAAGRGQRP